MKKIYKLVEFEDLKIDHKKPVFIDIENSPLKDGSKHRAKDNFYGFIELVQLYQEGMDKVCLIRKPDPNKLLHYLSKSHLVGFNVSYEVSIIQVNSKKDWTPADFDCVFLLSKIYFPELESFTLDNVYNKFYGVDLYGGDKEKFQKSSWDGHLTEEQLEYSAKDVLYLPKLYNYFIDLYKKNTLIYDISKQTLKYCFKMQRRGVPILYDNFLKHRDEVLGVIEEEDKNIGFNVKSSKQTREFLGNDRSDKKGLIENYISGLSKAKDILEQRSRRTEISYIESYLQRDKYLRMNKGSIDRIYGFFKPTATTGRLKSDCLNLQNIPSSFKKFFGYKKEDDRYLGQVDFSNIEMRGIASLSGDLQLCRAFSNKKDIHQITCDKIFGATEGEDKSKKRFISKILNFSLLYGGGVETIIDTLQGYTYTKFNFDDVSFFRSSWFKLYDGVKNWQVKEGYKFNTNPLGQSPLGRKMRALRYTEYLNHQNQSLASEVSNIAFIKINKDLKDFEGFNIINYVHDEFLFDIPKKKNLFEPFCKMVVKNCKDSWEYVCKRSNKIKSKNIPLPVEVNIGYNWYDVKEGIDNVYSYTEE